MVLPLLLVPAVARKRRLAASLPFSNVWGIRKDAGDGDGGGDDDDDDDDDSGASDHIGLLPISGLRCKA